MKVFIYTAAVLFCATIAAEDRCRINVPVTTSILKCGDEVYNRDQAAMDAANTCGKDKNGTEVTIQHVNCIFEKLGYIENGVLNMGNLLAGNIRNFPKHYEELTNRTRQCAIDNTKESDEKDQFKHVECRLKVFRDVCKHETCDWLNSFD